MILLLKNLIKVFLFFMDLWKERDVAKAKEKADIAKEIVNAFEQTNPHIQASRLNIAIARIRLRRE